MSPLPWRVLVADDDPTVGLLSRAALSGGEFETVVVDRGDDAVSAILTQEFDIALLDVEMPGKDGFAVCQAIRDSARPDLKVVLVSGRCDAEFLARAQALGAGHIAKPVDWRALPSTLRSLLD